MYGAKLHHLPCATNHVPLSYYELTAANVAEVKLTEEFLAEANPGDGVAQRLRRPGLPERGVGGDPGGFRRPALVTERSRRGEARQRAEICFASLKRVFGIGETLAPTLVGLVARIAEKITAYTYALLVDRRLGRPQGRIKELWA